MKQRSRYLLKNIGILTISNFSSKLLGFFLVPLYTSVLSTSEFGTYDLIASTISLVYPLLTANIIDAVMRFSIEKTCRKEETASIGIKYIAVSIAVMGICLFVFQCCNIMPSLVGLRGYIFFYYVFYAFNQYFIQLAKGLERVKDMGIAGVLSTAVMLVANIFFLLILKKGLVGFFIANILAHLIPVIYYFIRLRFWKMLKPVGWENPLEKEMLAYSIPLICTALGWWVNSTADKYTVAFMCGVAANGLLSVSYKIPSIINTLQGLFTQAWQISAIKEYGEENAEDFYLKTFSYLNVLMTSACAVLIILSKPLAHLLYAKNFYSAWQYVPFLMISSVLNCASGFVGPILSARKDSRSMALAAIYGACVNIGLNIILVSIMGIQGATIATVISSYFIYSYRLRAVKKEFHIKEYWRVLAAWGLLCVQAILEVYTLVWYVEIGCIIGIAVVDRKVLQDMFAIQKRTVIRNKSEQGK